MSTLLVGGIAAWLGGITSIMVAMLFGALISPTDPVSVLALFKELGAPDELKILVEGESLFNDATGVVLFTIILSAILGGHGLEITVAFFEFIKVSGGGFLLGAVLGWIAFTIMGYLEDHLHRPGLTGIQALKYRQVGAEQSGDFYRNGR